jgi:hypothetical protein
VQLPNGLPSVDFSSVANELLRQKLGNDWGEVQRCLANNLYSSVITAAKNVAESLVLYAVGTKAQKLTFEQGLAEVGKIVKAQQRPSSSDRPQRFGGLGVSRPVISHGLR